MALSLDKFRDVDLVIDKANDNFIQRQFVSQADYKGRTLTVQVTNNGEVGEIPGLFLNLRWQNQAAGNTDLSAFTLIDKTNSVFRIEYPAHMMTPGKVIANIQIIQDGKTTHIKPFELTVQNLAGEAVGIVEKNEYSALVAVLSDANKFKTDIDSLRIVKADNEYVKTVEDMVVNMPTATPKDTLNSLDALIAKYPNGDIRPMLVLEADGKTGYTYMWNGTTWVKGALYQAAGVADRSITTGKLELGAITRNVLQGVEKSFNAYDRNKRSENKAVGGAAGPVDNPNYDLSDFVEVTASKATISYARGTFAVFYDGDKTYLSKSEELTLPANGYTFTIPAAAKFLRVNIWKEQESAFMLVFGDALPSSYQPFFSRLADYLPAENSVSVDELDQVTVSANLFNKSTAQKGKAVSEGNLIDNANYAVSDFIKINPGQKYIATQARFLAASFFDKNMVYISELTTTGEVEKYTFNTPPTAYYLKFNAPIARLDEFMICEGDQLPIEFVPYQKSIDWLVPKEGTVELRHLDENLQNSITNIPDWSERKIITFGDSITWYDGQPYVATHLQSGQLCVGYQSWIREKLGATVINMGRSGYTMQQILNVVRSTDLSEIDIVTLTSGANDWSQEIPVGEVATPKSQFDENTFAGAAQAAIEAILEKNSKVKLVLIAPIKGYHPISAHSAEWQIGSVVDDMLEQPDFYYDTLKKLANLYGCYFVDLRNLTGLNWFNYQEYLLDDPAQTNNKFVHPGNNFYERIAEVVIVKLQNEVGAGF